MPQQPPRTPTPTATVLAAVLSAALLLAACTSDKPTTSPTTTPPRPASTNQDQDQTTSGPTTTAIASLDDQNLDDTQRACVEDELGPDADPNQVPADRLDAAVATCLRGGTFAQGFTDTLAQDHPDTYTDTQLTCLADHYTQLTDQDLQTLVRAGLDPTNPPPEADQILDELFASCDAPRPPR